MSFLLRYPMIRSSSAVRPSASRSFHLTTRRFAFGEDDTHKEDRHDEIDSHKEESLKKQKDGTGHWKKELASNSEAAIKADRDEIDATEESISKLQKETQDVAGKK